MWLFAQWKHIATNIHVLMVGLFCLMGNELSSWRASIGLFYSKSRGSLKRVIVTHCISLDLLQTLARLLQHFYLTFIITCFLMACNSANANFIHVIALLLLLSGDVELNPGPDFDTNDDLGALSLIHLNIRSIRHKLDYIFKTLSDYGILCFTESHQMIRLLMHIW